MDLPKMKHEFNENTKVTLTLGQIRKLVKESESQNVSCDQALDEYFSVVKELFKTMINNTIADADRHNADPTDTKASGILLDIQQEMNGIIHNGLYDHLNATGNNREANWDSGLEKLDAVYEKMLNAVDNAMLDSMYSNLRAK